MENDHYLYGASGHCKVIVDILKSNDMAVCAIIDDNPKSSELFNIPIVHTQMIEDLANKKMIISIGNNHIRKSIANRIPSKFYKAIHEKAIVSENARVEEGTVIMAGAIINADAEIGRHCIINTGSVIEHDCKINDFVHISPNASLAGNVEIGEGTQVGIGATVIQGIKIGRWAVIGAGTVIIRDVPDFAVVVGNPGKVIKYNTNK